MQKREAKYTTQIRPWILKYLHAPCVYEVKHTRGKKSFPLRELAEHQKAALLSAITLKGFVYKIPDCGYTNPFDGIHFGNMKAYVIIKYPERGVVIPIEKLLTVRSASLTQEDALKIATHVIE